MENLDGPVTKTKGGRPKSLSPKTEPIGTRWNKEILDILTKNGKKTPQQALNFLCNYWAYQNGLPSILKVKTEITRNEKKKTDKAIALEVAKKAKFEALDKPKPIKNEDGTLNFGDDKILYIEKYTKYPISSRPTDAAELASWKANKRKSDDEIRDQWQKWKINAIN